MKALIPSRLPFKLYDSPRCIGDEALSSWLWRVSARHGWSPRTLAGALGLSLNVSSEEGYARWTSRAVDICATTLMPQDSLTAQVNWSRGLARGHNFARLTLDHTGHPVIRFCPLCLASDATPYIRLRWRLIFAICCEKHECMLATSCEACGSKISLNSLTGRRGGGSIAFCRRCSKQLGGQAFPVPPSISRVLISVSERVNRALVERGPEGQPQSTLRSLLVVRSGRPARTWRRILISAEDAYGDSAEEVVEFLERLPIGLRDHRAYIYL
jgi:hypothetical protein